MWPLRPLYPLPRPHPDNHVVAVQKLFEACGVTHLHLHDSDPGYAMTAAAKVCSCFALSVLSGSGLVCSVSVLGRPQYARACMCGLTLRCLEHTPAVVHLLFGSLSDRCASAWFCHAETPCGSSVLAPAVGMQCYVGTAGGLQVCSAEFLL